MSQFISGTIKKQARVGGATRLLLTRKDGSEFVAVLHEYDRQYNVGTKFSQAGFEQQPDENGRKVYSRTGEEDQPATVLTIDTSGDTTVVNETRAVKIVDTNLAGHALTLAYLKQISPDDAIAEITALAAKLK